MKNCIVCGENLPKFKHKYCSEKCRRWAESVSRGACMDHGLLNKRCIVCGNEFQTFKSRKITCSDECSRINKNTGRPYDPEKERRKYLRSHPKARKKEDIIRESQDKKAIKRANYEKWLAEKAEVKAQKEAQKRENISRYLEYEVEHECIICGMTYIAHYPTAQYCSNKCKRKAYNNRHGKRRERYNRITLDKDISLKKLSERDHNQCQICGLFVNWDDYVKVDGTIICGDMYPSIDHIMPISLGGMHSWTNVQLAHRGCNTKKSNKYIG